MYGGPDAVANFVRATRKSNWFSQVPVQLSQLNGQLNFNQQWSAKITRGGDYMIQNWLRCRLSAVNAAEGLDADLYLRWTHNFMHNLIRRCTLTFNDIQEAILDRYILDFWAAFTVPAGKQVGYGNMIGNIDALVNPWPGLTGLGPLASLPERVMNLPLPLPHTRDHGLALPTAALPYNEIAINFEFNDWTNMLLVSDSTNTLPSRNATSADVAAAPYLTEVAVWANYAIVSNDERKKMGKAPRDILIEQFQCPNTANQSWNPANDTTHSFSIKYAHAVKVLFFAVENTTVSCEHSNYTTRSVTVSPTVGVIFPPADGIDPIARATLLYENTARLQSVPVDYFSLMNPWYHAITIPGVTGYHCYSYSLWFYDVSPKGSTNYGKLNQVNLAFDASQDAIYAAQALNADGEAVTGPWAGVNQTFATVINAVNHNIVRISGGKP